MQNARSRQQPECRQIGTAPVGAFMEKHEPQLLV
ncbi:MAG: hypothetical protein JWL59_5037 [Chthoniobacteraceae bacterium]|nr:hypothetical protein [Chthoniobacteraceae bacterium]